MGSIMMMKLVWVFENGGVKMHENFGSVVVLKGLLVFLCVRVGC